MLYQITAPPTATPAKQADELTRLLQHSKTLTIQFVTVAGSYKPSRARLVMLSTPDRLATHAARVMTVICSREDAIKQSQAVKMRPEWKNVALLVPTDPDAPAINGVVLDGWDSAFLTVTYRPGRVFARLLHCPEDTERVAKLQLDGWQFIARPNPLQLVAFATGRTWNGAPSLTPVPGGLTSPTVPQATSVERVVPMTIDAPAPIQQEINQALTESADGFLLGVTSEGSAVRLARRAMTLSVSGPHEARQRAVLALLRHGMQAGMGIVAVVDRALLPTEALEAWEARIRLLDVQNIADSSAIPWREIAPDLLAQAIGGSSASLPALPSRFGAVLDSLGAETLRVPAVLGLATMPGDNLRGTLASGGLVIVPQDGDAASTIVARLLLAYLATPPAIGRGLVVLMDAAIVPPEALRQQAIQVVVGERSDALFRLAPTDAGWKLSQPDGSPVAELLADLMAQPIEGAGDMVDSIVRDIGIETAITSTSSAASATPIDTGDGWWSNDERADDLDQHDEEPIGGVQMPFIDDAQAGAPTNDLTVVNVLSLTDDSEMPVIEDAIPLPFIADEKQIGGVSMPLIRNVFAVEEPAEGLDAALGSLLQALVLHVPINAHDEAIQAAVATDDFGAADALAVAWTMDASPSARPWIWRVVLAEEDTDRVIAAWRALQLDAEDAYAMLVRGVLDAMDAAEPAAWLASIGDEVTADQLDDAAQPYDLDFSVVQSQTPANLQHAWPDALDATPTLIAQASREPDAPFDVLHGEPVATIGVLDAADVPTLPAEADHGSFQEQIAAVTPVRVELSPVAPVVESTHFIRPPTTNDNELSDDAIRAAWQSGTSVPQLVARLTTRGLDSASARTRVRSIVQAPPGTPTTSSDQSVQAPRLPTVISTIAALPMVALAAQTVDAVMPAARTPEPLAHGMFAYTPPNSVEGEVDDAGIWQRWLANEKTDDMVLALCGKRGGPKADAARDRIYSVVVPRIVTGLDCDDLVDRLAAGETGTADPRYAELMKQIARSTLVPAGNLERSYVKRLISARQEV